MKTNLHSPFCILHSAFFILPLALLTTASPARAQGDSVTISAAEFQRMVYAAHLHTQLAEKPELDPCLQALLELQRRNPSASPAALADLSRQALERYRASAPAYIRTNGFRDEILAAYLDALRQVPAHTNFIPANLTLLSGFMLSPGDYATASPAELMHSGNQRLLASEGEALKRQTVVDNCLARAQANAAFATALENLLSPETLVSLHDSPVQIIDNTNSPLHDNLTMRTLLEFSATNSGSLTVASNRLVSLFATETQTLWDTIHSNLALPAEINQRHPDLLAYLTNQADMLADAERMAAVKQAQARTIASSTAAIMVQSQLQQANAPPLSLPWSKETKAIGGIMSTIATALNIMGNDKAKGLTKIMASGNFIGAGLQVFNLLTGTESPEDKTAREIGNIKTLVNDLSTNMNYRFDRVDQSLTTIFDRLNEQFANIVIIGGKIDHINGNVDEIRRSLLGVQIDLDRLERQLLSYVNQLCTRNNNLNFNTYLGFEAIHNGLRLTQDDYNKDAEPVYFTQARDNAVDGVSSPYSDRNYTISGLYSELTESASGTTNRLDQNLSYIKKYLNDVLHQHSEGTLGELANPRDWFVGAYAYAQLSVENPMYFRRINPSNRLDLISARGRDLTNFFRSLTFTGANINWPLFTALTDSYFYNLIPYIEQVSATEGEYATNNNFALDTWRQWDAAAPRVTAAATEVRLAAPKNLIAGGGHHSLALKPDGIVVGWGDNTYGQIDTPAGLTNAVAVAAGYEHSLALKGDGTVVGWGSDSFGQNDTPAALSNVVAIAKGYAHSLALKADGTVVGWGNNYWGQANGVLARSNVVAIAAGVNHSLALRADGTVVGWGAGGPGISGDGNYGQTTIPLGLTNVVAIAAGYYHSLALRDDGTVVGWGDNSFGGANTPPGMTNVVAIAAGAWCSLALKADGTVVGWGDNGAGQTTVPPGLTNVAFIALSHSHSLALKADGTVIAWGANDYGQCTARGWPASPRVRTHIAAGGYHSLALKADGSVHGWGENSYGQSTIPDSATNTVVALAAGGYHSLALKTNGTVVAWGAGGPGTWTGDNMGQSTIPPGLNNVVALAAGAHHSLALKADGTVVGWGDNGQGQAISRPPVTKVVAIAAGVNHSLALKADGTVVAWGNNGFGQSHIPDGLNNVVAIAAGPFHSLALKADGKVVAWGLNSWDQCNVPAVALSGVVAIAAGGYHSLALKADGTIVAWGDNSYGQSTFPAGLTNAVAITDGAYHSLALRADGTVVGWGAGGPGTSGGYNFGQTTIPINVVDLAAWGEHAPGLCAASVSSPLTAVTAGSAHSLALTASGSVVAWGLNTWGQTDVPMQARNGAQAVASGLGHSLVLGTNGSVLAWGLNDFGQTSVPASAQSGVVAVSAGGKHSLALKTDGTVAAWGLNSSGQTNVPANVQGKVLAISAGGEHCLALKADGAVVAWGGNSSGQTNVPAEAQISVVSIAAGRYHNLALKSEGQVVSWGLNSSGQCNVPVAAQSGAVAIAAGITHSLALKADGTVVVWGSGPAVFVPPQAWNNVVAIAAGDQHSLLLRANTALGTNNVQTLSFVRAQIPVRVMPLLSGGNDFLILELGRAGGLYDAAVALSGVKSLLAAVLELGMPYTLEGDDVLHGFLYGSESLMDTEAALTFLQAENAKLQATPGVPPVSLADVAVLRRQCFVNRLTARLNDLQATGQPEIPRLVGHTLRLLNLLRDAGTQPENSPPPALEMWSETSSPRLLLYGEPYARYTLQYRDTLNAPGWTSTTITNLHDGQTTTNLPPFSAGAQRFYRAMLPVP